MKRMFKIGILSIILVLTVIFGSIDAYAYHPSAYPYPLEDLNVNDGSVPECKVVGGGSSAGGWVEFNGTNYEFDTDHDVNQLISHVGGESKYDTEGIEEVLQKCYQTFIAWGMCPEGAAAVCGNISCESGGDPTMFGPNWGMTWDEVLVKSGGSFKGLRYFAPDVDGVDMGFGLIAFTAEEWSKAVWYIAGHQETQWTDLGTQLLVLSYEFGPRSADNGDDPAEEGKFFAPFYDENSDGKELMGNFNWGTYAPAYPSIAFDSGKGEAKCARLTCAYMANCERPGFGCCNASGRTNNALKFYADFKDLEPYDYSEGGEPKEKHANPNEVKSLVVTDQWELRGMPAKSGLAMDLLAPGSVGRDNLSVSEIYNVVSIGENIQESKKVSVIQNIRVFTAFFGLSLVVYGLMLLLAMMFDMWNNFFDFSLVGILSLGGIAYSSGEITGDDIKKYTSTKKMIIIILVIIAMGCLILSGSIFSAVFRFIYAVASRFVGGGTVV